MNSQRKTPRCQVALWACCASSSLFSSGLVLAQDDLQNLSLEELLQVRITSSTYTEESLKTVPSSITVFTRRQIQQLGVSTLEELANYVPGFQSKVSDDESVIAARSRRITAGNREVLFLFDGQRLNHDLFGATLPFHALLPIDNIERVEFIRGPGSAIYGANAFLGVINIVSETHLKNVSLSSDGVRNRAVLNLSNTFSNGLHTSISMQGLQIKDDTRMLFDTFSNGLKEDTHERDQGVVNIQASWGDWRFDAKHTYSDVKGGYILGKLRVDGSYLESNSSVVALNYQHAFNESWSLTSRAFNSPYCYSVTDIISPSPSVLNVANVRGDESGIENRLNWQNGTSSALVGVDFTNSRINRADAYLENYTQMPPARSAKREVIDLGSRQVGAIYAQWQDSLTDDITYILGVRSDRYSDVTGYTSPRLGLIWQLDEANTLKILYGEAFRAPARNEVGVKNNSVQLGNPNLEPEISKTSELIWMQTSPRHHLSVSLFNTIIEDPVGYTNTRPRSFFNRSESEYLRGVEVEARWVLSDHWEVDATLSRAANSAMDINPTSESLASLSLLYKSGSLGASFSGYYQGATQDDDNTLAGYHRLGGYAVFKAHIQYQVSDQWELFANIRNLGDRVYLDPAIQNNANILGVPGMERSFEAGVRWSF